MRPDTQQRVLRIILASLLSSDLSANELREVAGGIASGFLSRELARLLEEVSRSLPREPRSKEAHNFPIAVEQFAYDIVRRRRMSKAELVELLIGVSPRFGNKNLPKDMPAKEIIAEFLRSASVDEAATLLGRLQGGENSDAYLKGIVRRN